MRSIIVGVFLLACPGCVPERELSVYGEGAAPGLDGAPDEGVPSSGVPSGSGTLPSVAAAAADDSDPAEPTLMVTAAVEESSPSGAPLDPAPLDPAPMNAGSDGSSTTPAPEIDASVSCAEMGGFTIAETSSCYMLGDNVFTWQEARSFCQAWGADLVEIGSREENDALAGRLDGSVWIGATDQDEEGVFRWVGGAPLGYAGWSLNQPNNLQGNEDCAELRAVDERWSDVPCTGDIARRALCERP